MGYQIIRQTDDRFVIFSSITDTIVVWDATKDETAEWFAERAADRARDDAGRMIDRVASRERVYGQFALTLEEALEQDREHGGEAHTEINLT